MVELRRKLTLAPRSDGRRDSTRKICTGYGARVVQELRKEWMVAVIAAGGITAQKCGEYAKAGADI